MLETITKLSNRYGSDPEFVLAGGGNTSCKDDTFLYVKPSGVTLADIKAEDFVKLRRDALRRVFDIPADATRAEREAMVKKATSDAVSYDSCGRPSVEAPLHEVLDYRYVVHLHPGKVNGLMCGADSAAAATRLFPDALYVEICDPGYKLASTVAAKAAEWKKAKGETPRIVFLENHGVFVAGDSAGEIDAAYSRIISVLDREYGAKSISGLRLPESFDEDYVCETAPVLRMLLSDGPGPVTVTALPPFTPAAGPLTPDHVVYAKSFALVTDNPGPEAVAEFEKLHGYKPRVVAVPGKAVFCSGSDLKQARITAALAVDAAKVAEYAKCFGGARFMNDDARGFIENWEVESYRKKIASGGAGGVLTGKIACVTGGAQGFGFGIAEELVRAGAVVVIADMNVTGAEAAAARLNAMAGRDRAFACEVNISDEESVSRLARSIVSTSGGLDILVANAGVLRAGSVKTLTKKDFDFVTGINYTGYFLCVKVFSQLMARQNTYGDNWLDIVQVNSKSGLVGSNRNGAYAGGKFGTIGLTQSFALELVSDRIKVNSVCPGNFFDGPLWSDPERGLFVQYLNSGKVPGAKTVADVKAFYEAKIPMNRGCYPADVAKAIIYAVTQCYETGQAIPVTGGQVMLN